MKIDYAIPALILIVYLLTNLVVPAAFQGETIFIVDAVLWTTVIVATILVSRLTQTKIFQTNKTLVEIAAILAVFQIFLAVFLSFFMGFGKNANVWNPTTLAIYFPFLLIPLIAAELSRTHLTKTVSKRNPTLTLLLISIFYTLTIPTINNYQSLTTPLSITEFLIRTFIPTLAVSLLATYFAYLGGFAVNLTYMALPAFFTWFSPILPNIQWQTQSILTVVSASIGFVLLDNAIKPSQIKQIHRTLRKQKSQLPYWTAIALFALIAIWSTTGLLGFTPTIVASGSMQPALNPGDISLIVKVQPSTIQIGDIIQYYAQDEPIIHRVTNIQKSGNKLYFTTQGDANNAPDLPVSEDQVMGKAMLTIPQLGWVSIVIKNIASGTYTFFTSTLPEAFIKTGSFILTNGVFITSALSLTAYSYLLLTYRDYKKEEKI